MAGLKFVQPGEQDVAPKIGGDGKLQQAADDRVAGGQCMAAISEQLQGLAAVFKVNLALLESGKARGKIVLEGFAD